MVAFKPGSPFPEDLSKLHYPLAIVETTEGDECGYHRYLAKLFLKETVIAVYGHTPDVCEVEHNLKDYLGAERMNRYDITVYHPSNYSPQPFIQKQLSIFSKPAIGIKVCSWSYSDLSLFDCIEEINK